jgi:osmotically-inducible protein OsmY
MHETGGLGKILKGTVAMKTDMELQRDVLDEIAWEPSTCVPEIGVTVHDGVVTLTGSVDNLPAKWAID